MNAESMKLYRDFFGCYPSEITPAAKQGSSRKYYAVESPGHPLVVVTEGTEVSENEAFFHFSDILERAGFNVPHVLTVAPSRLCYIQTFCGVESLFDRIDADRKTSGNLSAKTVELIDETLRQLPVIQFEGGKMADFSKCFPTSAFDRRSLFWDLNYFKYCFLKIYVGDFNENALEDEFEHLAGLLLENDAAYNPPTLLYRDFQSRNVLINGDTPYFIDFQGARRGPIYYDLASFLWQSRAGFSEHERERFIDVYLTEASRFAVIETAQFRQLLNLFVFFRQLQTLGAYGFRGLIQGNPSFTASIPNALNNINLILGQDLKDEPFTELRKALWKATNTCSL